VINTILAIDQWSTYDYISITIIILAVMLFSIAWGYTIRKYQEEYFKKLIDKRTKQMEEKNEIE